MPKFPLVRLDWGFLLLLPIPLLWALLAQQGALERPENQLLDLRFRVRGEIPAPVKLIYVDVDTRALQALGERPWNREQSQDAACNGYPRKRASHVFRAPKQHPRRGTQKHQHQHSPRPGARHP